jgi:thiol-disulfide isomerase/thioredoxin
MPPRPALLAATLAGLLLAASAAAFASPAAGAAARPGTAAPAPGGARQPAPPPLVANALPPGWARLQVPLPPFELTDVDGKVWRLRDLEGRKVLFVVWATWCGFCRQELPLVEELRRRLAGRDDLEVVTLNIDRQPARVEPFLAGAGYTFPTLFAADWFFGLGTDGSIPRNWIVDDAGVVRLEQRGFAVQRAGAWIDEVTQLLEELPETR